MLRTTELERNDGNSNSSLICKKLQYSNSSSNLISGFAKNANLSNGIFKDETRMHPRARKKQQNGDKCHAAILLLEQRKQ